MRLTSVLFLLAACAAFAAAPTFVEHTLATDLKGGYQVLAVDMNHDGKLDLLALASGVTELYWFENPTWERHIVAGNLPRMINVAPWDTDGDGIPELVLASAFENEAKLSKGILSVLTHNGDPRQPWTVQEIDRIPTSHRLRWADIDGSGKKVLVNSVLTGVKAEKPDYRDQTPLYFYRPGEWKREMIGDENSGVVHGILVDKWSGSKQEDILTASFTGIHRYHLEKNKSWTRTEIAKGDPAPWPKGGSSDIAVGRVKGKRFIAAIEPWHGTQVAVYQERSKDKFDRAVIDAELGEGHTIVTADFDGDGRDEIIAGDRGKPRSVNLYQAGGAKWVKTIVDKDGMAASACTAADLNGDGKIDIACIGQSTTNLKWYENTTGKKR